MTRADILRDYKVDSHGVITSPGKFEGEMIFAPYFWEETLIGGADDTRDGLIGEVAIFHITSEELIMFPELDGASRAEVWETEDGFVIVRKI